MKLIEPQFSTKKIAQFEIDYLQFIGPDKTATQKLPDFATDAELLRLYRAMALVRALDIKTVNLQRTGQMGTYPSCRGQEAVGIGGGDAMHKSDVFVPYYRDQGILLMRESGIHNYLTYWGGDERGTRARTGRVSWHELIRE